MRVVQITERRKGFKHAVVGVGEVELVFAIVLKKKCVSPGEQVFIHVCRIDRVSQRKRPGAAPSSGIVAEQSLLLALPVALLHRLALIVHLLAAGQR